MQGAIAWLILTAAAAAAFYLWYSNRLREQSLRRVDEASGGAPLEGLDAAKRPFPPRFRWAPPLAGVFVAAVIHLSASIPVEYPLAFGLLAGVLAWVFEERLAVQRSMRIEAQLADALDLMTGALRAGTGLLAALEAAYAESRDPFRTELRDLIGRIRLGEDAATAIRALAQRIPLETFRFFATSFCVHWETGGSMAQTLGAIGRTIRDRIELSRRVQAQAVEVHASVVGIMAISYAVTFIMWRANPDSLREFLSSTIGAFFAASAIVLQAVGIFWISKMSRVRF
jgi:tight adherence protein B